MYHEDELLVSLCEALKFTPLFRVKETVAVRERADIQRSCKDHGKYGKF